MSKIGRKSPRKNINSKTYNFLECNEPHQVWSACTSICQERCNNYPGQKCAPFQNTRECVLNVCVCDDGYALVAVNKCAAVYSEECGGLYDPLKVLPTEQIRA